MLRLTISGSGIILDTHLWTVRPCASDDGVILLEDLRRCVSTNLRVWDDETSRSGRKVGKLWQGQNRSRSRVSGLRFLSRVVCRADLGGCLHSLTLHVDIMRRLRHGLIRMVMPPQPEVVTDPDPKSIYCMRTVVVLKSPGQGLDV